MRKKIFLNYKNKNYEAMKQNIAFMFLLISVIERDKKYKNREKDIGNNTALLFIHISSRLDYIIKLFYSKLFK